MATVVTIDRPDVVALIEEAAHRCTGGDKTEAIGLALRLLLDAHERYGSLSGASKGPVAVPDGVDFEAPVLHDAMDA